MSKFDYNKINQAYDLISSYLIKTPLVTSDYINKMMGSKIYFKLENLQLTGSFKFRGATHKISKLTNLQNDVTAMGTTNATVTANQQLIQELVEDFNRMNSTLLLEDNH